MRCRQARHRFTAAVGVSSARAATPLRLAYADPPYPGRSARYYADHPDYAGEVDHTALLEQLSAYDGWALSTAADALPQVLASRPPGVRVAAWVRGERPNPRAGRPLNAWEPVIYWGGRTLRDTTPPRSTTRELADVDEPSRVDVLIRRPRPRATDPGHVTGAKPADFARWIFDLLGAQAGDELDDLFPGSGGIDRAWSTFTDRTGAAS